METRWFLQQMVLEELDIVYGNNEPHTLPLAKDWLKMFTDLNAGN